MKSNKLRVMRNEKRISQQDVAEDLGITCSYYGMIEKGVRTPNLNIAYKLASFFNTTIENIFFKN